MKSRSTLQSKAATSPFRAELERALEHFHDPEWLGKHSPLAEPYLLGSDLARSDEPQSARARGVVLQRKIRESIQSLAKDPGRKYDPSRLLEHIFLRKAKTLNQSGVALTLGISPATFYRQRLDALTAFEDAFARAVHPAQRTYIPRVPEHLFGRSKALHTLLATLSAGRSVAITGGSGVGKSSLAAAVAHAWAGRAPDAKASSQSKHAESIFWYPFRLGFSDHLASLLYALGYFFHVHGASALWLQMASSHGRVATEVALSLVRECLAKLDFAPLFVFDESDLLLATSDASGELMRLRAFLEALFQIPRGNRTHAFSVLFVGQQLLMETDLHLVLKGLSEAEVRSWLNAAGVPLPAATFSRLYTLTQGSPLVTSLFLALCAGSESSDDALRQLENAPTLGMLIGRVLMRLSASERRAFSLLAVCRGAIPAEMLELPRGALEALIMRGTIVVDGRGGVSLPGALREAARMAFSAESHRSMHLHVGKGLATRGEFTEAAWHLVQGGNAELAIHLWYANRAREIARGNGAAALDLFKSFSRDSVAAQDRKVLALIRSELHALVGASASAVEELGSVTWPVQDPLTPDARQLQGDALRAQGQSDAAVNVYREGLRSIDAIADVIAAKYARLHASISDAMIVNGNLDEAWRAALRARFISEISQGSIQEQRGIYTQAQSHYEAAIKTIRGLDAQTDEARVYYNLANLAARQERFEDATRNYAMAQDIYAKVGDLVRLNRCRTGRAGMMIQMGRFDQAVDHSSQALAFFDQVGHAPWAATNASNLAEACLGLGRLDEAEHNALRALNHEDETSRTYALTVLGSVALGRKQPDRAEATLREAIAQAQATKDRWAEAPAWRVLAQALRSLGRESEASTALQTALQLYTELGLQREVERTRAVLN